MVAPNPYAPFKAREDGPLAVLPVENLRLRRPRTCPRGEGTYTFSAAPGTEGNYLDEVWTIDDRVGVSVADLNDTTGSDRHFYHCNTLYSVYALTDETGAIAEAVQSYDAYGKISALITGAGTDGNWFTSDDVTATNPNVSTIGNTFFYTGQRVDPETGLQYSKNRYLSVDLGRWISRDPVGYGMISPTVPDLGLYQYVGSRTPIAVDMEGLTTTCWGGVGASPIFNPFFIAYGYLAYCYDECGNWMYRFTLGGARGFALTPSGGFQQAFSDAPCLKDILGWFTDASIQVGLGGGGVSKGEDSFMGKHNDVTEYNWNVQNRGIGAFFGESYTWKLWGDFSHPCPCEKAEKYKEKSYFTKCESAYRFENPCCEKCCFTGWHHKSGEYWETGSDPKCQCQWHENGLELYASNKASGKWYSCVCGKTTPSDQ